MSLLLRTRRPIKQVAAEVGFQNEKSFMRAFKGWTGVTADEFRIGQDHPGVASGTGHS
jgi:AraC-like DNA-binding protein